MSKSIKTKNLNFKPLYDAIISKGYKPANNKFEVEIFAVHSSTVNRSNPIFSGTITDLNQAINIDYKKN